MPVNTAALKTFAPAMRRQLLEAVGRKLDLLLHSQTPDTLSTYAKQIAELREQEAENRDQLLERVAYTWFNRLCALRYLDARGWHPFGCKVLMPAAESETQPELLKLMRAGSLPHELKPHIDESRLHSLLDGQIPTAISGGDPQAEVFRCLLIGACRSYHRVLPALFEAIDDSSELLLPDELLSDGSILGQIRGAIKDSDCDDVSIIGWLYQYYNTERKDSVMSFRGTVSDSDIPAVTQLFTPEWIVRYMVDNTLGELVLGRSPSSVVKSSLSYLTRDPVRNAAAASSTRIPLEEIALIDPACGSGHILLYAFDLFAQAYELEGYSPREIPSLIIKNNLYGLEICPRAAQLAMFALMCKARQLNKNFFNEEIDFNICILSSTELSPAEIKYWQDHTGITFSHGELRMLRQFATHVEVAGSLIKPVLGESQIRDLLTRITAGYSGSDIVLLDFLSKAKTLLNSALLLSRKYHVVVANPPYLGRKGMNSSLRAFLDENYKPYRTDLFSAFIARLISFSLNDGAIGCMSPNVWMFIPSHEELRKVIVDTQTISTLVELPLSGFTGATVQICAFVLRNSLLEDKPGVYIRLVDFKGEDNMASLTLDAVRSQDCPWRYECKTKDLARLDGTPISYWISNKVRELFQSNPPLASLGTPRSGITTGDNGLYIRYWYEVEKFNKDIKDYKYPSSCYDRWVPINGGSEYRKWYGSNLQVIDWEDHGRRITNDSRSTIANLPFQFKSGVTWTKITSSRLSVRLADSGFIFTAVGLKAFPSDDLRNYICGFLNSVVVEYFKPIFSSTVSILSGDIARLPLIISPCKERVELLVQEAVALARLDWDAQETSWDFEAHPLIASDNLKASLAKSWESYRDSASQMIAKMFKIEMEINELFIQAYELDGELSPIPSEDLITLARPSSDLDCRSFLSYAVGCVMGRYSPHVLDPSPLEGSSSVNQAGSYPGRNVAHRNSWKFQPDPDAIIPVLDGEWFEDDIVARTREFLAVTFPESTVTENLRFIENSLGKDIRKYFCTDFYKDHLQTYKKRPIYWMVQSPKKGFACLIYLHRYTKDTLNQVLNNYFRPYLQKLEARLAQLGLDQLNDSLPTRERTAARKEADKITKVLKECQAWEQDALLPLAQQRIELDLDDGVKVNYLKLQDVLATIPGLAAKDD